MPHGTGVGVLSLGVLGLAAFVAVAASGSIGTTIAAAFPAATWWHAWLWLPAFVVATCWLLLTPGFLIVASFRREASLPVLVLFGFALSHVILIAATSVVKIAGALPFTRAHFLIVTGIVNLLALAWYMARQRSGSARLFTKNDGGAVLAMLLTATLIAVLLLPEIFWIDISADGFEAVEMGRALQWVVVPRFPSRSGFLGMGIGMVTMTWSNHWWTLLIGPLEAASRLPLTLHAVAMLAGIGALAEHGRQRVLATSEWLALALTLGAVIAVLGFNSSYDPTIADLSSPTAFEALTIAMMCGMIYSAWTRAWGWFALFALLAVLARPTGLLVGGMFGVAIVLVDRREWRMGALVIGLSIAAFFAGWLGYEKIAARFLGEGGIGYGSGSLLSRFQYVTFTEPSRLLWVVLPAGVLPWLSMAWWKRLEPKGRQLVLVTLMYTALFLPLSFTNLHQFVPAMVFPVVVFWRLALGEGSRSVWAAAATGGAVLSFAFALPTERRIDRELREVGYSIDYRIGSFSQGFREYREALNAQSSVQVIVPEWDVTDLERERTGGNQLVYYAMQQKPPGTTINYVVQGTDVAPPSGLVQAGARGPWKTFVVDTARWRDDREGTYNIYWRRAPYEIPRTSMFAFLGAPAGSYDLDLAGVIRRLRRMVS